jgi:hypothetical protein
MLLLLFTAPAAIVPAVFTGVRRYAASALPRASVVSATPSQD